MIHYRHDGKPKRTLCGLRIAIDGKPRSKPVYETGKDGKRVKVREVFDPAVAEQPRVLPRDTTWMPEPLPEGAEQELADQGYAPPCRECLSAARAVIAQGQAKARAPRPERPKPRRPWLEDENGRGWSDE